MVGLVFGQDMRGDIFKELCSLLEVRKTRSSPRNPKCNGAVERFNLTILHMIKAYLRGEQIDWDLNSSCLAAAYRATPHESAGMTPNMLMLGREVRLPAEIMFGSLTSISEPIVSYGEYVDQLRRKMQHAHYVCRKHLEKAAFRQKYNYDAKQNLNMYKPGDPVWLLNESRTIAVSPKLQAAYDGPYVIAACLSNLDFRVQKDGRKSVVIHHDKLKPYRGLNPPKWAVKLVGNH